MCSPVKMSQVHLRARERSHRSESCRVILKYHKTFRMLGDTWTVEEDVMQMLEAFVCVMYGCPRERSVNTCRAVLLKKMVGDDEQLTMKSKVELSKLPPCQDNLCQHIRRVNHRLGILKNAHTPVIEHPEPHDEGQGWTKKNEVLEPLWAEGPILPPTLVDLVENVQAEMEEEDDDGCLEISVSDDDE
ncbi:uncharacterized protein LOC132732701 [Ruditapes philippinarum]|uniref:uncharacterized protein LOC132732701 n=1 Tax=Ruditapes philippinarum TaxID=129788 RepID=UPI00295B2973|nr:uncharacterized protein LOC132732701 [Ruditapes philippinarum]